MPSNPVDLDLRRRFRHDDHRTRADYLLTRSEFPDSEVAAVRLGFLHPGGLHDQDDVYRWRLRRLFSEHYGGGANAIQMHGSAGAEQLPVGGLQRPSTAGLDPGGAGRFVCLCRLGEHRDNSRLKTQDTGTCRPCRTTRGWKIFAVTQWQHGDLTA